MLYYRKTQANLQENSKIATKIIGDELNGTEYPRNEYTF